MPRPDLHRPRLAAAGALCVDHLADLGHRWSADRLPQAVYERATGFAQRLGRGRGGGGAARVRPHALLRAGPEARWATVEELLREPAGLTGIVGHNEPALHRCWTRCAVGRGVPETCRSWPSAPTSWPSTAPGVYR